MNRRFAARRDELLADAEVDPAILRSVLPRLECFLDPFVQHLQRHEQSQHARDYVAGLLSDLDYKNVESIAYLHDHEREPLQQFIGQSPWDHDAWIAELTRLRPIGLRQDGQRFGRRATAVVWPARQVCRQRHRPTRATVGDSVPPLAAIPFNKV